MKTLNQFLEQAEPAKADPKLKQDQKRENMLKKRVLMAKMRAVRQGATGIMASHEPEGEVLDEADPRLAIYQSGMTDASRVKGPVGKAVDKVKDKVKKVLGKKDKVSSHLDRYRFQSGLDNYLKSKVKKEEVEVNEGVMKMIKSIGRKKKEKKAEKAMDAGARLRRKVARKVHAKYVSGSEDLVPDDIREASAVNEANRAEREGKASDLAKVGTRNINRFETGTVKRTESSGGRRPTYKKVTLANPKPGYGKRTDHYKKNKLSAPDLSRRGTSSATEPGPQKHHTQGVTHHDPAQRQRRQEHKARRGVKTKGTVAADIKKSLKEEDKALAYVKKQIAAKYGKDSYVSKDNPRKKQSDAEKKRIRAINAKRAAQDTRDETEKASDGRYSDRYSNRGSD